MSGVRDEQFKQKYPETNIVKTYEANFVQELLIMNEKKLVLFSYFTFHYILVEYVLSLNNSKFYNYRMFTASIRSNWNKGYNRYS